MSATKIIGCAALVAGGIIGFWYLLSTTPLRFGANASPEPIGYLGIAYGYLVTVLGVFLGSAYKELQRLRGRGRRTIRPVSFFRSLFGLIDLWMGLFASPIVYALLISNLDGGGTAGLTVLALENGFCCTIIASQLLEREREEPS